ncbi:hypothetical protein A6A29_08830 [Streptomyces sp. TSRI0281]|nr:hypothetical protein A6A29_08830 [Streptomyces sp. TSRI0281]
MYSLTLSTLPGIVSLPNSPRTNMATCSFCAGSFAFSFSFSSASRIAATEAVSPAPTIPMTRSFLALAMSVGSVP